MLVSFSLRLRLIMVSSYLTILFLVTSVTGFDE